MWKFDLRPSKLISFQIVGSEKYKGLARPVDKTNVLCMRCMRTLDDPYPIYIFNIRTCNISPFLLRAFLPTKPISDESSYFGILRDETGKTSTNTFWIRCIELGTEGRGNFHYYGLL